MKECWNLTVRHFKSSNVLAWRSLVLTTRMRSVCKCIWTVNFCSAKILQFLTVGALANTDWPGNVAVKRSLFYCHHSVNQCRLTDVHQRRICVWIFSALKFSDIFRLFAELRYPELGTPYSIRSNLDGIVTSDYVAVTLSVAWRLCYDTALNQQIKSGKLKN